MMSKEKWDERFSEEGYTYGKEPNAFIKEKSTLFPAHAKIGCFAEGEGRNAVYLATLGHGVTAFDQSAVGLEKTKQLAQENEVAVETIEMDLTKEKVASEQFDAAIMVFGHVKKTDQPFFIQNVFDSVKDGGTVVIEVYSENQLDYGTGGPPTVGALYKPIDVLNWIKPYKCPHFYYGEAIRNEGFRHAGVGHVIQVVAEK